MYWVWWVHLSELHGLQFLVIGWRFKKLLDFWKIWKVSYVIWECMWRSYDCVWRWELKLGNCDTTFQRISSQETNWTRQNPIDIWNLSTLDWTYLAGCLHRIWMKGKGILFMMVPLLTVSDIPECRFVGCYSMRGLWIYMKSAYFASPLQMQ